MPPAYRTKPSASRRVGRLFTSVALSFFLTLSPRGKTIAARSALSRLILLYYAELMTSLLLFAFWGVVSRSLDLPPIPLLFAMTIAGALTALLVGMARGVRVLSRWERGTFWVGLNLALDLLFLLTAFRHAKMAIVISLHYLGPLIVIIGAPDPSRRPAMMGRSALALLGLTGVAFLVGPSLLAFRHSTLIGLAAGMASAFTLAGNIILQRRVMSSSARPTVAVFQYNAVIVAIIAPFAAWFLLHNAHPGLLLSYQAHALLWAGVSGVLIQGVALLLFNAAAKHLRAHSIALLSYTEVAWAALLGYWLFGQTLDFYQVIGVLIVVVTSVSAIVIAENAPSRA